MSNQSYSKRLFWVIIVVGAVLPFAVQIYASIISDYPRLVWWTFFSSSSLFLAFFNDIPFIVLAFFMKNKLGKSGEIDAATYFLRKNGTTGAAAALLWVNLFMHISVWTSRSSTASLGIFFLFIYAFALMPVGYGCGWLVGKLNLWAKRRPIIRYTSNIFIGVFIVGSLLFFTNFGKGDLPPEPKIRAGEDFLQKDTFFEKAELGTVTSITVGHLDPDPQAELVICGSAGAAFVTRNGDLRSFVRFEGGGGRTVPIDIENDGICEFMNRRGGSQPVSLFDHQGHRLWQYNLNNWNVMAAGDLDGDGRLEFVVGNNGGLHLLDEQGNLKRQHKSSDVFHVEVLDTDGDGRLEIVYTILGSIVIRDMAGKILRHLKGDFAQFSLTRWPDAKGNCYIILVRPGRIQLLNFVGEVAAEFNVSQAARFVRGTPVPFEGEESPFFAIVVALRRGDNRSILYLFNSKGDRIYQEVLLATEPTVAVIPSGKSNATTLLVGGDGGKVWQYTLRPSIQ